MKIPERTGMWVEMDRSTDCDDEITVQVPHTIWAGWMMPVRIKEDDLATFLRSIGWQVTVSEPSKQAVAAK